MRTLRGVPGSGDVSGGTNQLRCSKRLTCNGSPTRGSTTLDKDPLSLAGNAIEARKGPLQSGQLSRIMRVQPQMFEFQLTA